MNYVPFFLLLCSVYSSGKLGISIDVVVKLKVAVHQVSTALHFTPLMLDTRCVPGTLQSVCACVCVCVFVRACVCICVLMTSTIIAHYLWDIRTLRYIEAYFINVYRYSVHVIEA